MNQIKFKLLISDNSLNIHVYMFDVVFSISYEYKVTLIYWVRTKIYGIIDAFDIFGQVETCV